MMRRCLFAVLWTLLLFGAAVHAQSPVLHPVCDLLTQVIIDRMGADVNVSACEAPSEPGPWTHALPDAAARAGEPSWFTLIGPGRTTRVQAAVTVEAAHARALRPLPRGRVLTTADLQAGRGPVDGAAFHPIPAATTLTDARVMRAVAADAVVQRTDVVLAPVVKAGEPVVAVVRIGRVEVTAAMTAVDAGSLGDSIRVAHRDRKRVLRATVVGPGRVEVIHEG